MITHIGGKYPYYIKVAARKLTFIAGLWNYAPVGNIETGEAVRTFTLTRDANELLEVIHNGGDHSGRMPHVLPPALQQQWLDPNLNDQGLVNIIKYAVPSKALEAWPVNSVRKRKDDDESVIVLKNYEGLPEL